ncbi:hypothetical protein [Massilia sp. LC238]|jgi:hypothetical protein|uniref:hypothetical protein n=1 Tax=Massilia sp. LC238 TaxID=1502852 RepID=UPI0012698846|nr:hypothetical protein [Massilia sp. LC238]
MKPNDLFSRRIPKQFSVLDVVCSIVGHANVASCDTNDNHKRFTMQLADDAAFIPPSCVHEEWMKEIGIGPIESPGKLFLPALDSRDAAHIATAAHEACHARMFMNAKGNIWRNEKITNQLAANWLRKNLSGMRLHVALETITQSNISYGIH